MFKVICNQKELMKALSESQKAVGVKTTMDILKNFYIEAFDNSIKVVGYNLEIGISSIVNANVIEKGKVSIEAKLFSNIINKLPNEEITLYLDGDSLKIECKKSKFSIKCSNAEEFPSIPTVDESKSITLNSKLFKEMVKETVFATSEDQTKPILTGELLKIKDNKLTLVAIDGYRLAVSETSLSSNVEDTNLIIPGKTLNDITSLVSNSEEFKMGFNDSHIIFNINKTTVVSRLLDGEFIDYSKLIKSEHASTVTVNRKELLDSVDRISLLSHEKNNLIKLNIRDNFMQISSNNNAGDGTEEVSIELSGDYLDIAFNSRYFIDALKNMDCENLILNFSTNVNPCLMNPIAKDDKDNNKEYLYLLLPVRVSSSNY